MNFDEFTQQALRTESKIETANVDLGGFKTLLRMFIVVGTLLDYTKKGIFYNNYEKYNENYPALVSELNDLLLDFVTNSNQGREDYTGCNYRVLHGILGSLTESAELAEHLLRHIETGEIDKAGLGEEYSDGDWYKAIIFDELGIDESTVRMNVINKLRVRFPDKFCAEHAANRDLKAEREELEKNI